MAQCKNCESLLEGPFCQVCGQKDVNLERPFRELVGEIIKETLDLDGRAWRTVKTLFLQPGRLTSEFLAGKRKLYTPPLRLYLFISVSFFVLMAWVASQGLMLEQGVASNEDAAVQAQFMSDRLPRLMFVLLPAFAALLKIFFSNRLYFDHLIFSVHLHSATYVILALMLPLETIAASNPLALAAQLILLVYFVFYFAVSMHHVYTTTWLGACARAVAILFMYMIAVSGVIESTSNFQIISD